MADLDCPKTELPVSMCAHCRGDELPTPESLRWFTAEYAGRCANCGDPFESDDEIAWDGGAYVCCTRTPAELERLLRGERQ